MYLSRKILTITVGNTLIIRRRMLIELLRLLVGLMLTMLTAVVLTDRLAMAPMAAPDCQRKAVVIRRGCNILAPVIQTMMSDTPIMVTGQITHGTTRLAFIISICVPPILMVAQAMRPASP